MGLGATEVTATIKKDTYTCKVYVKKNGEVENPDITLSKSDSIKVYYYCGENVDLYWNADDESIVSCEWEFRSFDEQKGSFWFLSLNPKKSGSTKVRITNSFNDDVVVLNVTVQDIKALYVPRTDITCSSPETLNVTYSIIGGKVRYEVADTSIVKCEWGKFDGDTIPLYITPVSNGRTTINIIGLATDEQVTVNVLVTGLQETPRISARLFADKTYAKVILLILKNNGTSPLILSGPAILQTDSFKYEMFTFDGTPITDTVVYPGQEIEIGLVRTNLGSFYIDSSSICGFYFNYAGSDYVAVIDYNGSLLSLKNVDDANMVYQQGMPAAENLDEEQADYVALLNELNRLTNEAPRLNEPEHTGDSCDVER